MSKSASGVCCVIKSCRASKRKVPNLRLFKFPKNNDIQLQKWLEACRITDVALIGTKRYLICHRHFNPDQLGEVHLKKNAVPQRFLDTAPPSQIIQNTDTQKNLEEVNFDSDIQENSFSNDYSDKSKLTKINQYLNSRKSGRRCIIPSCRATYRGNPKLRFFSFPNPKSERFAKWVEICKLTPDDLKLKNIQICDKHFWKADLCGKRYTADAEPKFFLSAPRYKVIGPSDPNFKAHQIKQESKVIVKKEKIVEKEKIERNKCIIKTCGFESNNIVSMTIFPKEALNLFDVWSDIFKLDPAEVFNIDINTIKESNNLYICKKHSLSQKELHKPFNENIIPASDIKNETLDNNLDTELYRPIKSNLEKPFKDILGKTDNTTNIKQYYEEEIAKVKREAEKERIKHLSIINQLKEENFKLKDEINNYK